MSANPGTNNTPSTRPQAGERCPNCDGYVALANEAGSPEWYCGACDSTYYNIGGEALYGEVLAERYIEALSQLSALVKERDAANKRCGQLESELHTKHELWCGVCARNQELLIERDQLKGLAFYAFVDGAKWWEFESTGGTMWQSDQSKAEQAAIQRYPYAPHMLVVEANAARDAARAEGERLRELLTKIEKTWREYTAATNVIDAGCARESMDGWLRAAYKQITGGATGEFTRGDNAPHRTEAPKMLQPNDVVQIIDETHAWFPCLALVHEVRETIVLIGVLMPNSNVENRVQSAMLRIAPHKLVCIGSAAFGAVEDGLYSTLTPLAETKAPAALTEGGPK